ncbi:hypothetical protein NL676_013755 [Syzygium grande]|nr:hypothetical protein NL676_013755 [Syzygium grande]
MSKAVFRTASTAVRPASLANYSTFPAHTSISVKSQRVLVTAAVPQIFPYRFPPLLSSTHPGHADEFPGVLAPTSLVLTVLIPASSCCSDP